MRYHLVRSVVGLLPLCAALPLFAQDGSPDTAYGAGGLAQSFICTNCINSPAHLEFDPQGRVVVVGEVKQGAAAPTDVFAARYTLEGEVDSSFGVNGIARGVFCTSQDKVMDMAIAPDGSIYVAGYEYWGAFQNNPAAILRWTVDGELDTTWGPQGTFTMDLSPSTTNAAGIAVQADGKLVVGGYYHQNGIRMLLARLNTNGTFDDTFGSNGLVLPDLGGTAERIGRIALQPDGKILVAAQTSGSSKLVRFLPDGALDLDFGLNGVYALHGSGGIDDAGIYLLPDGRITVVICINTPATLLVRLLPNGEPDPTYGLQGAVAIPGELLNCSFTGHCMLPDGRIVVGRADFNDYGVRCVDNTGALDPGFGVDGIAWPIAPSLVQFPGMDATSDGRFAISARCVSTTPNANEDDVAAMMYLADSTFNSSTGLLPHSANRVSLHPSLYSGGPLYLETTDELRTPEVRVLDAQGRVLHTMHKGTIHAQDRVDIGPLMDGLSAGAYTVHVMGRGNVHARTRVYVVR